MLGWMLPAPISGVLVCQVWPQSSVMAISEKEKPVRVERHDQALAIENERMRAGHPPEPAIELVPGMRAHVLRYSCDALAHFLGIAEADCRFCLRT